MNNSQLKSHKHDNITLLEVVSMEGRYYMARFYLDGQGYVLTDSHDEPVMFTGAAATRKHFENYQVQSTEVIPPTGTDEMIGMPDSDNDDETMRVPL
jgi:hypothetical protein